MKTLSLLKVFVLALAVLPCMTYAGDKAARNAKFHEATKALWLESINLDKKNKMPVVQKLDPKQVAAQKKANDKRLAEIKKLGDMLTAVHIGGKVDELSAEGETALIMASRLNFPDSIKWLRAQGADTSIKNAQGKTAMDLAASPAVRTALK